jgi:predicted nuclease with TOPRIM domain
MDSSKDLSSVLKHVETLQSQLAAKESELKEARDKEEAARARVAQLSEVNSKLSEAKREQMRNDFNERVRAWVRDMDSKQVPDDLKEEFLNSAEKFVNEGNDVGAWKVICCASAVHQNQVNAIQKLTEDYNALKKTVDGGEFGGDSRKRKEMEPSSGGGNVWEQLEGMCRNY